MNDEFEILTILQNIARQDSIVRLENIYKGLPVSYDATILSIGPNYIQVECNRYQIASLYLNRSTYIIHPNLSQAVSCTVAGLRPAFLQAYLGAFDYSDYKARNRDYLRVNPDEPVRCELQLRNSISPVIGTVADISSDGIGVYLDRSYFYPKLYQPGTELMVRAVLPGGGVAPTRVTMPLSNTMGDLTSRYTREGIRGANLSLDSDDSPRRQMTASPAEPPGQIQARGKIIKVYPELHSGRYRLGIQFLPDDRTVTVVSQYISHRQAAIIREFKTLYDVIGKLEKV